MSLQVQFLMLSVLFSAGLGACLWLCLSAKAEWRGREKQLERRIGLLEERMEQAAFSTATAIAVARAQAPPLEARPMETKTASPGKRFEYEVPIALPPSPLRAKLPEPRPEAKEAKPELNPEQLDFLASLKAGV